MCPIDARFKHFQASKAKEFQQRRKLSSIMWTKVLSIMPAIAGRVRPDYPAFLSHFGSGYCRVSRIDRDHNPGGETTPVGLKLQQAGSVPPAPPPPSRPSPSPLPSPSRP